MMMHALKHLMICLLLTGALGQPALADMDNRKPGLSAEEMAFAFGDLNADGFKVLSPEEMAEIKGALAWITLRRIFFGSPGVTYTGAAIRAYGIYLGALARYPTWNIKLMVHVGHHRFPDKLYYRHWQITRRTGRRGDKAISEYIPFGKGGKQAFR